MKSLLRRLVKKIAWRIRPVRDVLRRGEKGVCIQNLYEGGYRLAISPENLISREYLDGEFCRYDVLVRLMAIESYHNGTEVGLELYNKMQTKRGAPEGWMERFTTLIQKVAAEGFQWERAIDVNRYGLLLDGSHRVALALYHQAKGLSVRVCINQPQVEPVDYRMDWFREHDFTEEECGKIVARKETLFRERGLYFSVILWPPVAHQFDDITRGIAHRVVSSSVSTFEDATFDKMVREIYEIDDIAEWKVDKKLEFMRSYPKTFFQMWMELPNPRFRKKDLNYADISQEGEKVKRLIRNTYKSSVPGYFYDVICHTGDNFEHNRKILKIFQAYNVEPSGSGQNSQEQGLT